MTPLDYAAVAVFLIFWLGLEQGLVWLGRRRPNITSDMEVVREAWMRQLLRRNLLLVDAQIVGHTINSASFFGSANLIVIVGIGGAVFSASDVAAGVEIHASKPLLLLVPLVRGLFDFIWSVRQLNYFLAAMASSPHPDQSERWPTWAPALAAMLSRALSSFSAGVRNYYFAAAAALWLLGPLALMAGAVAAAGFLIWRQCYSATAQRIHEIAPLVPREIDVAGATDAEKS